VSYNVRSTIMRAKRAIIQIRKEYVLTELLRNMITRYARMIVKFCEFDIQINTQSNLCVYLCSRGEQFNAFL
jgi:hypothetical protein